MISLTEHIPKSILSISSSFDLIWTFLATVYVYGPSNTRVVTGLKTSFKHHLSTVTVSVYLIVVYLL